MSVDVFKQNLEKKLASKVDILSDLRRLAWLKAWEVGAPEKKTEAFRYTNLKPLWQFPFSHENKESGQIDLLPEDALTMVDGVFRGQWKHPIVEAYSMKEAFERYGVSITNRMHKMLPKERSFFSLLNKALQEDGLFLYIPANTNVEMPIEIIEFYHKTNVITCPRIHIVIGAHSSVKIAHKSQSEVCGDRMINGAIDISLEEGAKCELVKVGNFQNDWAFSHIRASLKKESELFLYNMTKGASSAREDLWTELLGEGASVHLYSTWHLKEKQKLHTAIRVEHIAPYTNSTQHVKGVVGDHSRASFEGQIYVHSQADKTNAYQLSNQLILNEGASAFSKPNLEVFADDVKASHGATVSDLSDEELFYLQSRGLSPEKARKLLIKGFTHFFINDISFEIGKKILRQVL